MLEGLPLRWLFSFALLHLFLPIHPFFEPADKKRKRDKKGNDVFEEGKVVPFKELKPQKGQKLQKGRKRSPRPRVRAWREHQNAALGFGPKTHHSSWTKPHSF